MVNFRRTSKPRNYLSRGEQWRMLLLVMSLGLVYFMMTEARDPKNWRWFSALGSNGNSTAAGAAEQTPIDNRITPSAKNELPNTFISPDETPPELQQQPVGRYFPGVEPQLFKTIRDGTIHRKQERESWFNLLRVLEATDQETLDEARPQPATYVQLFQQSDEYRGELVTVSGTVRRACREGIARNDFGIKKYWQVWLRTRDNQFAPLVVYCLYLPEGFPTGMEVSAEVEITGFFFKRWKYNDANSEPRTTPMLVARTVIWQPPPAEKEPSHSHTRSSPSRRFEDSTATDRGGGYGRCPLGRESATCESSSSAPIPPRTCWTCCVRAHPCAGWCWTCGAIPAGGWK